MERREKRRGRDSDLETAGEKECVQEKEGVTAGEDKEGEKEEREMTA